MGANEAAIAGLNTCQRELVYQILDYMNPVSLRSAGVAFDNKAKMPRERIVAVKAPTLIFHATGDTLQLYRNAQFAASAIPGRCSGNLGTQTVLRAIGRLANDAVESAAQHQDLMNAKAYL